MRFDNLTGAYTTHNLVCRMALTSYDQVPAELAKHAFVEFTMPATQVCSVHASYLIVQSLEITKAKHEECTASADNRDEMRLIRVLFYVQASHVTVRSVSLQNHDADPPEKYVRYLARHEYM